MFVDDKETKKAIGRNLKEARTKMRLSVDDVTDQINQICGPDTIAKKTVYGWESGQASPSSIMLGIICKIYCISNIEGVFAGVFDSEPITAMEMKRRKDQEKENALKEKLYVKYIKAKKVKTAVDILLGMND